MAQEISLRSFRVTFKALANLSDTKKKLGGAMKEFQHIGKSLT